MTYVCLTEAVVGGFGKRLKAVAEFKHIATPLPMRNSRGAVVYYLFFASQKPVAERTIIDIFNRHQQLGRKG